jgi:hypothetical protein
LVPPARLSFPFSLPLTVGPRLSGSISNLWSASRRNLATQPRARALVRVARTPRPYTHAPDAHPHPYSCRLRNQSKNIQCVSRPALVPVGHTSLGFAPTPGRARSPPACEQPIPSVSPSSSLVTATHHGR